MSRRSNPAADLAEKRKDPAWRARAEKVAQAEVEGAQRRNANATAEDKLAEAARMMPTQLGLPVQWNNGARGNLPVIQGRPAPVIHGATANDVQNYAQAATRTCGSCRYFGLREGQHEIVKQRFAERLVLEQEWRLHHLGAPLDHMGVCKASGGTMATSTVSNADGCDQYRPKSRLFG